MLRKDAIKGTSAPATTARAGEVAKFEALAQQWRDPQGKFRVVHAFNAARLPLLLRELPARLGRPADAQPSLQGVRLADIGCAVGLISEQMARAGADVLAIDAAVNNIALAREAALAAGLTIDYRVALPEQLDAEAGFDAVLSLEIIEHVADLDAFLRAVARLVRPQGVLVIGTLNRTLASFIKAIIGAEYVFRLLPRGTHDWRAFVRPGELTAKLHALGLQQEALFGLELDPLTWRWRITGNPSVNYVAFYRQMEAS